MLETGYRKPFALSEGRFLHYTSISTKLTKLLLHGLNNRISYL